MIPRILWMLSRFAVEIHTLPVHLGCSLDILHLKGCWDLRSHRSDRMRSREILGIHPVHQETFFHIHKLLRQLRILRNWIPLGRKLPRNQSTCLLQRKVEDQSKTQIWDASLDSLPKILSPSKETLQRIKEQSTTTADFRSSIWQILHTSNVCLLENKNRRLKYLLVHNFPTEAMHWIKEVEMVYSMIQCLRHQGIKKKIEVLDVKIASALNKIIHNSQFKRRLSLEEQKAQKQDSFLRGRQIAYLIYDHFRVTGSHDSVENYTHLFTIVLRNDDIQEFDSKWDGILLSMTKIPPDDILEGLYKLRVRESEKLKTVLEVYDLEIHQKRKGPDYHILKTMVKRSIEQNPPRILGPEMEITRRTPWSRIREQNNVYKEFLETVGNGKPTGSVWKEIIAVSATIWISVEKVHHQIRLRILSCGTMSENHREPEVPEKSQW